MDNSDERREKVKKEKKIKGTFPVSHPVRRETGVGNRRKAKS